MGKIRFNVNVESASWDSGDNRWHLVTGSGERYSCDMLIGCTGYFSYENPYEPKFPGMGWSRMRLTEQILDFTERLSPRNLRIF